MKPLIFEDKEMTVRLTTGWEDYDVDERHRTLEVMYYGTSPNPKEVWKLFKLRITEQGLTAEFKKVKRKEQKSES